MRKRGELLERSLTHCYDTGAMRRTHLRGHGKILKRLLIHVAAFNLSLVMRALIGVGKPRALQGAAAAALKSAAASFNTIMAILISAWRRCGLTGRSPGTFHQRCPLVAAA